MKAVIISISIAIVVIGGAFFATRGSNQASDIPINNVSVIEGKQIVTLAARDGYSPRYSTAKSGIPTIVRFITKGTFDCSSSVRIPSLGVSKILPQTGTTDIDIGTQKTGKLIGSCGMGMYPFEITFE